MRRRELVQNVCGIKLGKRKNPEKNCRIPVLPCGPETRTRELNRDRRAAIFILRKKQVLCFHLYDSENNSVLEISSAAYVGLYS